MKIFCSTEIIACVKTNKIIHQSLVIELNPAQRNESIPAIIAKQLPQPLKLAPN